MIMEEKDENWWKHGIIYHLYPLSFQDSNDDGIGDIRGIINRLDYIAGLGVKAIWLSPIYRSPMKDHGYDISDYCDIDPTFGSLDDFHELLEQAHAKGLKVIMDLVMNHTSDQHPWFLESKSSVENPKRNWYIWHSGKNRRPPNNWRTNYLKRAWNYHPETKQYYHHSFFKEQPDLNWHNAEMKKAFFENIKFWLNAGVDGFRLDVINLIVKDHLLRSNKIFSKYVFNRNQPQTYRILQEFRQLLNDYPDKTSVGEIYTLPPGNAELASSFLGDGNDMLHLAFDFSLFFCHWNASLYQKKIQAYYDALPAEGWPCFALSNHDLGRSLNRFWLSFRKQEKAKLQAVLLLTLKGTPFVYYGEEIGMENVAIKRSEIRDQYGKMIWPLFKGRDKFRTPMQWDDSLNGGFTTGKPWLPLHKNYLQVNVKNQAETNDSMLNVYKHLIGLRNKMPVLQHGEIQFIQSKQKGVLCYERTHENQKVLVALNFTSRKKTVCYELSKQVEVLFSTHSIQHFNKDTIFLNPFEAIVLEIRRKTI